MAQMAALTSFSSGTVISSSDTNTNNSTIRNTFNNHDDGTSAWQVVNVTATTANPVKISGNQSTTELSIDNTATDGDPILSFELGGTSILTMGVDDGDSDKFKIGSTAIGTQTVMEIIPTAAPHVKVLSDDATTELAVDNTAADGDPVISFELSGTATYTMGVDDGDSDQFKIGSTAIGTSTYITIPSAGGVTLGHDAPGTPVADTLYADTIVKGWMKAEVSGGTPSITLDVNFDSITDNGVGDFTLNITTDMANTNYSIVGITQYAHNFAIQTEANQLAGSCRVYSFQSSSEALVDTTMFTVIMVGPN